MNEDIDRPTERFGAASDLSRGTGRREVGFDRKTSNALFLDLRDRRLCPSPVEVDDGDPRAWVMLGEARERSKSARDLEGAMAAYERALALDARHAGAHRGLGLLLYRDVKKGGALSADGQQARRHLVAYLQAAPEAPDVAHVRSYVDDLGSGAAE